FFSRRRRHTRSKRDWSSDVCSSDLSVGCFLTYALTKSKKAAYGLIIIGFIVAAPIIASYGPIWSEIVLFGVIGMALGFIYLQWEIGRASCREREELEVGAGGW